MCAAAQYANNSKMFYIVNCSRSSTTILNFSANLFLFWISFYFCTINIDDALSSFFLFLFFSFLISQTLISASKLDAQLYPILTKQTNDLDILKQFLSDKLKNVLADIEKAQIEITHHIKTTAELKARDEKTAEKISQVLHNLNAIVDKLSLIQNEFRVLIESMIKFVQSLSTTKSRITQYFERMSIAGSQNIEELLSENNRFTEEISTQFHDLLEQSEQLIDRIRRQEPTETKEHDIRAVMSLLDHVRLTFETRNKNRVESLKREVDLHRFRTDLNDIFQNIDSLKTQLSESQGQYRDNKAAAKTAALSFDYFDQTIQVSDDKICATKKIDPTNSISKQLSVSTRRWRWINNDFLFSLGDRRL